MDTFMDQAFFHLVICCLLYIFTARAMITIGPGMYPSNRTLTGGPNSVLVLGSCEFMHNGTLSNFNFYVATTDWMALQIWRPVYRDSTQMTMIYHRLVQPTKAHRVIQLWIEDEHINVTSGDHLGLVKLNNTFPIPFMFNPQIGGDLWFRRLNSDADIPKVAKEYVFEELSFPYHFSITVTFKPDISDFYSRYIDKLSKEDLNISDYKGSADIDSVSGLPLDDSNDKDFLNVKGGEGAHHDTKYGVDAKYSDTKSGDMMENRLVKGISDRMKPKSSANTGVNGRLSAKHSLLAENLRTAFRSGDDRKNTIDSSISKPKKDISESKQDISESAHPLYKSQTANANSPNSHNSQRLNAPSSTNQRLLRNVSIPRSNDLSRYFTFSQNGAETQEHTTEKEEEFTLIDNITDVQGAANIGLDKLKPDSDNGEPSYPINKQGINKQSKPTDNSGNAKSVSGVIKGKDYVTMIDKDSDDVTISDVSLQRNNAAATSVYLHSDSVSSNNHITTSNPSAQPLQPPEQQSVEQPQDSTTPLSLDTLNQPTSVRVESSTLPSNQPSSHLPSHQSERSVNNKVELSGWSIHLQVNTATQAYNTPTQTVDTATKRNAQFLKSVGAKANSDKSKR